ncbi:DUF6234 family protein [Streptomyces sp. NPDC006704]|uniref:DUF6234 family protein n=1 Tax=Streptomyces sp. NPDC006704 TaxID=3364760 RepID=UPI0036A367C4
MSNLPPAPPVPPSAYGDVPDRLHRGADAAIGCALGLLELVALAVCVVVWPFIDLFELDPQAPQHPYVFWHYAPAIAVLGGVVVIVGLVAIKGGAPITAVSQLLMALLVGAVLVLGSVAQQHDDDKFRSAPEPTCRALIAPPVPPAAPASTPDHSMTRPGLAVICQTEARQHMATDT